MGKVEKIVKRSDDFAEWYTSVIQNSQLCVYGKIKGTLIFQPNAWSIWEEIRKNIDIQFKKVGVKNLSMPLLIPKSEFMKEKKHLEGFSPECFIVTQIGDKELEDQYIIRPTSEIPFCNYFSYVASSYKNLPIKVNQWCSVLRGEKTTKPFLRNSEFHWQELHAIFEDKKQALQFTKKILDIYEKFMNDLLCIPTLKGEKTVGERFAGAENTFTLESLMQDGQILQCATSHYLGQNFSKIYNIKFQTKNNEFDFVHQMSAGVSTRLLGAIIMVHGDDNGLVLPPDIAPNQIVINTIGSNKEPKISDIAKLLSKKLTKYRVQINDSDHGLGYKLADGEVQGTPIQIIVGNETIKNNEVTIIRRDNGQKINIKLDDIKNVINTELKNYKIEIYNKAKKALDNSIVFISNIDELKKALNDKKIVKTYWAGTEDDEKKVKELTGATPRCIIKNVNNENGNCFFTKKQTKQIVIFGRAY